MPIVTIAGYDGGTGASPLTSIKHAGSPWESAGRAPDPGAPTACAVASRSQADGGMRTGRDVVVAALLGADEIGFAHRTADCRGCIMMRKCHLNTCPVGAVTQDPDLRKRFTGKPEHVILFLLRRRRGAPADGDARFRTFQEMIGQMDRLDMRRAINHWKAHVLDYSRLLTKPCRRGRYGVLFTGPGSRHRQGARQQADRARRTGIGKKVKKVGSISTSERQPHVPAPCSPGVSPNGTGCRLPEDTIKDQRQAAGQSFGAWLAWV